MSLVALAESLFTCVCETWSFLLLRNATEPAAAPLPSSSAVELSFLWSKPVHVSSQSQCQTALTSGGPTVNELKSVVMQRCSLASAGYTYAVAAVRRPPLVAKYHKCRNWGHL